ncbi:MAG: 3-deoxy-7-phosphoheptulonate synthase [Phycisphaerales bacterium]|nr:3-deoxy-7-phosphoheptulonate synthase [Phycisphaerales bacterium]
MGDLHGSSSRSAPAGVTPARWTPESWQARVAAQMIDYPDRQALDRAVTKLSALPPLVTSGEVERLTELLAQAQEGRRFLLQGGDCAETLVDCRPDKVTAQLKILLQMSLVLVHGMKKPVIRVGRFAGQYAKPRTSATETRDGQTLPSYFGDLVNGAGFDLASRTPDPDRLLAAYQHAAVTLNFIRALIDSGFADLHHPENWDLRFMEHAGLRPSLRAEYHRMTQQLAEALRFMEALGDGSVDELSRVEFFTSHEGLNLFYESAQTREVPRKSGWWNLTTHLPWIGERTRNVDGAHVEYFRGIRNPVAIKLGPDADPADVVRLINVLNPDNEPGRTVLVTRMGATKAEKALPSLLAHVADSRRRVLWVCDPMHGNTRATDGEIKTRHFDDILQELEMTIDAHTRIGTNLGGVHFELTGEDVTECVGGSGGVTEADLTSNYESLCDPRLNYQQALEMAFLLARRLAK